MFGYGNTHIGKVRNLNEDAFFVCNDKIGCLDNLYIVADGVGGNNAGEVASQKAIDFFVDFLKNNKQKDLSLLLNMAGSFVNKKICELSKKNEQFFGMATTFSGVTLRKDKLFVIHIGDSRVYLIRNKEIKQLTKDHTYIQELIERGEISVQEAKKSPERNIITRAVGGENNSNFDVFNIDVYKNDCFLICSDGLTEMLTDEQILQIIENNIDKNKIVNKLINNANLFGGKDNISLIFIN